MRERARARYPALAGALSFVFPGLGQAYARQPILAALLAVPVGIVVLATVLAATLLADGLRTAFFSSQFLTSLLFLDAVLLLWRLFAIMHAGLSRPVAYPTARKGSSAPAMVGRRRPWEIAIVLLLVAATVGIHAWTAAVISSLDSTLSEVLTGGQAYGVRGASARGPLNQPNYHWDGTRRITVLLLGIDSGAYRSSDNTDTILVVSIDPVHRHAALVSVPRDTGWMPLPDRSIYADGRYPAKINSLAAVASANPKLWCPDLPAGADCGIRSLERSVGLYLGIPINYYATLNLDGFAKLIDAIGGLRICVPGTLADPEYGGPTWYPKFGIILHPGCQVLDGPRALAYARIRKGTLTLADGTVQPQDDFKREARQQEVLLALRDQFATSNWVFALPSLLQAVSQTVSSDFPRDQAGNLASLLPLISGSSVKRTVLSAPDFATLAPNPQINYVLIPERDEIRSEMRVLFGADGPLQGWYVGSTSLYPPST
jgi:LCP family protein required for cell wall assembly